MAIREDCKTCVPTPAVTKRKNPLTQKNKGGGPAQSFDTYPLPKIGVKKVIIFSQVLLPSSLA